MPQKKQNNSKKENKPPLYNYAKYSGIAFQMVAIIIIGVFGGMKIDKYFGFQFPVFTVALSILSVFFAIYYVIRDLLK
ncbi:MAG: AtpZ/AtpI family protein [Chlorobi bacterium]|nr:AtpZ/AtpI family protein [Chlorobiota bacterium]